MKYIVTFHTKNGTGWAIVQANSGRQASEKFIQYWGPTETREYGELLSCDAAGIAYEVEIAGFATKGG